MKSGAVIAIFSLIAFAALFYFYFQNPEAGWKMTPRSEVTEAAIAGLKLRFPPAGQKLYINEKYLFSLFYPANFEVQEYVETLGTHTIVFEDPATRQGFQIFITNSSDESVEAALAKRFRIDVPSGVRQNERPIAIGETPARTFLSQHELLGDTVEVWLLDFEYLYEITSYRDFGEQVFDILETWQFPKV